MAEERAKRKLSAILSADVKGYSRLMGEDELATIETLKNYREIMVALVNKFRGRVVDSPGDNVLAEFSSVVDALECSVEIQKELKQKNEELAENRRMEFRIGVNLGDVVEDGERIYGDGVNIAARVESLAEGGGICISGTAFDQIGKKLALGYQYLGEQTVKNIEKPVRIYRVLMEPEAVGRVIGQERPRPRPWRNAVMAAVVALVLVAAALTVWNFYFRAPRIEPASVERMAFPLPDKPSIAVLPFVNMSDDPKQEYFSDGLTEEIITALSKIPKMFVIARNSTFTYKGKPVKVQQVAEELGVRYVLEGMVRIAGDRMRITVQLIDAMTGNHLWAERYDRELKEIFALQDDITKEVMTALQVKLTTGEQARVYGKGTDKLEAYLKLLQGREHYRRGTKEDNILARRVFEEVIALDPKYAIAYRFLSGTHHADLAFGTSKSPKQSIARAIELAKRAIAIDDSLAEAHGFLGFLYTLSGQYEKGIEEAETAVALDPNSADAHIHLGAVLHNAGRREEAIPIIKRAIRLNPIAPALYFVVLGRTYRSLGRYEEAIEACKNAVQRNPDFLYAHVILAGTYSLTGKEEQARTAAKEVLRIDPNFSLGSFAKRREKLIGDNKTELKLFIDALRKAGLPD
jgi:adenylate cyclase